MIRNISRTAACLSARTVFDQEFANQRIESGLVALGISPAGIEGSFIKSESYVLHSYRISAHILCVHSKLFQRDFCYMVGPGQRRALNPF